MIKLIDGYQISEITIFRYDWTISVSDKGSSQNYTADEVDICCIMDGKVIVGEATSSKTKPKSQLNKLNQIARIIRADEIVISTTAEEWGQMNLKSTFSDWMNKVRVFAKSDLL